MNKTNKSAFGMNPPSPDVGGTLQEGCVDGGSMPKARTEAQKRESVAWCYLQVLLLKSRRAVEKARRERDE